jgi:hypothetical protein
MRTLDDILGACRIDDIAGCWVWAAGCSTPKHCAPIPTCAWGEGYGRGQQPKMSAFRAAWLASGRTLNPGDQVWRTCGNLMCVNPAHCKAGPAKAKWAWIRKSGQMLGNPNRILANNLNRASLIVPRERVAEAEALLSEGLTRKDIRARTGLGLETIRSIAHKQHPNSTQAVRTLPGASVFNWR